MLNLQPHCFKDTYNNKCHCHTIVFKLLWKYSAVPQTLSSAHCFYRIETKIVWCHSNYTIGLWSAAPVPAAQFLFIIENTSAIPLLKQYTHCSRHIFNSGPVFAKPSSAAPPQLQCCHCLVNVVLHQCHQHPAYLFIYACTVFMYLLKNSAPWKPLDFKGVLKNLDIIRFTFTQQAEMPIWHRHVPLINSMIDVAL